MEKKVHHTSPLAYYSISKSILNSISENTVIVCIGTDKCIGDCLGPLVGTILNISNFPLPVYGSIDNPIHALNLNNNLEHINKTHPNAYIIGIDACLGKESSIGEIHIRNFSIHPGKGVGKSLPEVGDKSIVGIVDSNENVDFFYNKSIRLSLIFKMANVIARGLIDAYYEYEILNKNKPKL
ncbi:putative sporulation protein YyaC [Clostridium moniliforme]|uniref:Sporulation protein YyaC n=1 Tax=Clostridium moniliforme TaxID=39489 RepID=A0ABS4F2Z2_9CLOT|nr:spore protease YyaC [Clostridium moniliforme]MBP1890621.1 putative sporulation protein YyaC [Clostridium moniliforme]